VLFSGCLPSICCLTFDYILLSFSGTSKVAKFLRANGITYLKVREQTLEILGKSDYFYSSLWYLLWLDHFRKPSIGALNEKLKSGMNDLGDDISMYWEVAPCHFPNWSARFIVLLVVLYFQILCHCVRVLINQKRYFDTRISTTIWMVDAGQICS